MKTEVVRVRLTEQEKTLLQERAERLNMSMSDYIKYCCLVNPPITQEKKDRINTIVENVKTTMMVEGLTPSDETLEIGKHFLNGEITENEAIESVKRLVERLLENKTP